MKAGQLFWGFLFLTLGALFLLVKFDIIIADFSYAWDLWPVTIILLGILIIVKKTVAKPVVASIFGIFVGYLIFGSVYSIAGDNLDIDFDDDYSNEYDVRYFTKPYNRYIEFAKLELDSGAGKFVIDSKTDELFEGIAKGNQTHEYYFSADIDNNKAYLELDFNKKDWHPFQGKIRNRLGIKLNDNPVWDLDFNIGAAKANFDLSDFKVRSLKINTGATDTDIIIGDLYEYVSINVEMGATSLEIDIPKGSGCKITGDMVLFAKSLEDFEKIDSDYYLTENYEEADKKINIKVYGGVSKFSITRY
ncbi:MAG: DUF5668 domain-containing protein [Ignavibacteria bacterium]|jgi:hypothetical protein